ncbi:hypothetical protein MD484_g6398, partial [Candolleomyces efflorescens]
MAVNIPHLGPLIDQAMMMNPTIFAKALPIQLEKLIIEPCMELESLAASRWLIVVDGLDECVGAAGVDREQEQELVLNLLISLLSHSLPFSVLLCARAESWLKDEFNSKPLSEMTAMLPLYASSDTDRDMLLYLETEFERIATCPRNAQAMRNVPKPWPPAYVPHLIVARSSGQFVFANTAIRFLDDRWKGPPEKRLAVLLAYLKRSESSTNIFSPLDALYVDILEACPNAEIMLQVLGEVICFDHAGLSAERAGHRWDVLDDLFERTRGESFQALRGLHSLVDVGNFTEKVKRPLFHTSFRDFLTSPRAGKFFIDLRAAHARLVHRCVDHLERRNHPSDLYSYASSAWMQPHLFEAQLDDSLLDCLLKFDFLSWFTWEIQREKDNYIPFVSLQIWGQGLFRLGQIRQFQEGSSQRHKAQQCSEHFQSGYDRCMVWVLDSFTKPGFLKRFFEACFSPELPGISVSAFRHDTPGSPPDYFPILTFEDTPLKMLPLKGVNGRLKSSTQVDPANDPGAKSAVEMDEKLETSLFSPEFGSHFDIFSQPFLMFLADPARSLHHHYLPQTSILSVIRTMLVHPSGFPGLLEASRGCENWDPIQLRYPFAQWFA